MKQPEHTGHTKFPAFPYTPYSIQVDFMNSLYESLDRGGISMLESPTGTGKTLSIICSSLQWLVDHRKAKEWEGQQPKKEGAFADSEDEPDWLKNYAVQNSGRDRTKGCKLERKAKRTNSRGNGRKMSASFTEDENLNLMGQFDEKDGIVKALDDEFLLEDYESEVEGNKIVAAKHKRKVGGASGSSSSDDDMQEGEDDENHKMKVYFCSRTHSQLSQFVKELRKTVFASELNVICLGSRKLFCINEDVRKLGSLPSINERCLELQNKKKSNVSKAKSTLSGRRMGRTGASGCPMLRKHKLQNSFRNDVVENEALDIEDLVDLGRNLGTCPYYGSRSLISVSDLVVLPYQSLLSKSARESLGLDLKGNIVIIDEAHNLADSLISMYNAKVTLSQLQHVNSCLTRYFQRFRNLLGAGNRRYIQTLVIITQAFLNFLLDGKAGEGDLSSTINEFVFTTNIDNINLVKLVNYMKETHVIYKVSGYTDKLLATETPSEDGGSSSFQVLVDLLLALTNSDSDGKIIVSRAPSAPYIKYVMLTGEKIFSEIVDEAHAVVMAGGTLQPVEEMKERLFPGVLSDRLHFFSCGHIIPPESILPLTLSRGPSGKLFDFSYTSRSSMMEELGFLICNLVSVVPEGIVVFFSSFDYEAQVYNSWKDSGTLERILKRKRVFQEPRKISNVETVLKEYKDSVDAGAVFLAVVGGKVSEGINFSDGMGRCIVMAGLPYPSPSDVELIERIKHLESQSVHSRLSNELYNGDVQSGIHVLRCCKGRGRAYYENLCMKAVNQSIGRAIRHVNDYAAILLVDHRYACEPSKQCDGYHPASKLPEWIKSCLSTANNYGDAHRLLRQFFKYNSQRGKVE